MSELDRVHNPSPLASEQDPYAPVHGAGEGAQPPSPFLIAHSALKGRYRWAIALAAVFSVAGTIGGYKLTRPTYRCAGMIEVVARVPRVLYMDEEKGMPPMFEMYLNSQVMLLQSPRVVEMAVRSDGWKALGLPPSDNEVGRFYKGLAAESPRRTACIEVSYTDEDPVLATVAVKELIGAYKKVVDEREAESGLTRLQVLENERMTLTARLNSIKGEILTATDNLGTQNLQERCNFLSEQVNHYDAELGRLRLQLAGIRDGAPVPGERTVADLTNEEIALRDDGVSTLLVEKREQEAEIAHLTEDVGLLENHSLMVEARKKLRGIDMRIEQRARQYREANGGPRDVDVPKIEKQIREYETERNAARTEAEAFGRKLSQVTKLDSERIDVTERLADVQRRINEINTESEIRGRINVLSEGSRPAFPATDKRLPLAFAGCSGGIALGFGLVVLWGMRDARLRHIVDVERRAPRGRFLGIVPEIGGPEPRGAAGIRNDASSASMADYCVHHIRTMLQLGHTAAGRVVAFTSPSPGSGKTTLEFALGASFGASGSRTLLIDCDFIGHGTSSALRALACGGARRALAGEGTVRSGFVARLLADRATRVDDADFAALLADCRERAGEGDADVSRALRALEAVARTDSGSAARPGVLAAIEGRPLEECLVETCFPNLAVLPAGASGERDAQRLSPAGLDRLLLACRDRFDTVLVDTGPILGSLEAAFATVKADEVVLVVTRGEMNNHVDLALQRLEHIGARVAGVVFNRAAAEDVVRSSYASRPASSPEAA